MPTINATLRALSGNATEFNDKYALIYEDLDWTNSSVTGLSNAIIYGYGGTVIKRAVPLTATSEDMIQIWNDVKEYEAQIAIPIFSSTLGVLMSSKYGEVKPNCSLVGINVPGQLDTFWDLTSGGCEYEMLLQGMHNTSRTPLSVPFWNNFVGNYSAEPLYTAIGAHGAVYLFANAAQDAGTLDADAIVLSLEKIDKSNPVAAAGGWFSFTANHDVLSVMTMNDPTAMTYSTTTLFTQWQADGKKVVVSSGNAIYLVTIVTGTMQLPDWLLGQFL
jgi:branched-chain amino acid transport system substrate-binding protein